MTDESRLILLECLLRERADVELGERGPRYRPSVWFGDGQPLSEKVRVRFLRALRRLVQEGMASASTTGGKLSHVRLTAKGKEAAVKESGERAAAKRASKRKILTPDSATRPASPPNPAPSAEDATFRAAADGSDRPGLASGSSDVRSSGDGERGLDK